MPNASFRTLIQQGQFNHVSVISGTTEDEETFSLAGTEYAEDPRHPFTATDYQNMVNTFSSASFPPGTAAKVQAIYPLSQLFDAGTGDGRDRHRPLVVQTKGNQ